MRWFHRQPALLERLNKPWFTRRPKQLLSCIEFDLGLVEPGWADVECCFGNRIHCDTSKAIGRTLYRNGVYELSTSELLWRVLPAMDVRRFVDVGANVGYHSVLAIARLGSELELTAFEPVPELADALARNLNGRTVTIRREAVSNKKGTARLSLRSALDTNDGLASLEHTEAEVPTLEVPTVTLDGIFDGPVGLLKLDVEGHEAAVLHGATRLLSERAIANIVFEEHDLGRSSVLPLLLDAGYTIRGIGWTAEGVTLAPEGQVPHAPLPEAPNYLATLDEGGVERLITPGWSILGDRIR